MKSRNKPAPLLFAALTVLLALLAAAAPLSAQPAGKKAAADKKELLPTHPSLLPVAETPGLPRLLIIGDSISMGYTLPVRELLAGKANVIRPPVNCQSTIQGIAKMQEWLGDGKWDVIHFNFGSHDLKQVKPGQNLLDIAQYEKNLREILTLLKATGAKLIFATSTPVGEAAKKSFYPRTNADVDKYNEAAARVMKENGVAINDIHAIAKANQSEYLGGDSLHYNKAGSAAFAAAVVACALPALEKNNTHTNITKANAAAPARKAPYRVIFSNDTTNIPSCVSPYHKKGEPFRPEMLQATVDEVAGHGVDAHFIQLAHAHVPWYQSKYYPIAEHLRWWREHYSVDPLKDEDGVGSIHRYVFEGGDLLKVFVERCREKNQAPFVSVRMNDMHHAEHAGTPGNARGVHAISRFYVEHPEYRIGEGHGHIARSTYGLNWAIPAVRERMFAIIAEQCRNYDIDGLEMDFMRHPAFFRLDETTPAQRLAIMVGFIKRVRAVLDENPFGHKRWLCVRIPAYTVMHDAMGIDATAWAAAGVEMFNVSPHYFTVQQTDLAQVRNQAPGAAVYLEMCHTTWLGKRVGLGYDALTFRRTTKEQYQTAAHLAYANGADGVSLFNFVYYREHGDGERGPFNEPPFDAMDRLGDKKWIAAQPQHWVVAPGWNPKWPGLRIALPYPVSKKAPLKLTLDLAPPAGGWKGTGRMRIQTDQGYEIGGAVFSVTLNGRKLETTGDTSEPFANPYPPMLGTPATMRAWEVPASALKKGENKLEIKLLDGPETVRIAYWDMAAGD